jgi:hypothetical protein
MMRPAVIHLLFLPPAICDRISVLHRITLIGITGFIGTEWQTVITTRVDRSFWRSFRGCRIAGHILAES